MKRLSKEERRAVRDLEALAARWPLTLGLFSASGTLYVMRLDGGGFPMKEGRMDRTQIVDSIRGITNDGGDPW